MKILDSSRVETTSAFAGETIYVQANITNLDTTQHTVRIAFQLLDNTGTQYEISSVYTTINGTGTLTNVEASFTLPTTATGTWKTKVYTMSKWPSQGGWWMSTSKEKTLNIV